MATLWMKFPDEALFSTQYDDLEKRRLEKVFSTRDPQSPWMQALAMVHLPPTAEDTPLIKWHGGAPYFNWSCMADTVSGGAMQAVRTDDGGYRMVITYQLKPLWHLMTSQWKLSAFLKEKHGDSLIVSIALGLVLQSMMIRIGPRVTLLAEWLANPASVPKSCQKVVADFQAIQMRRTAMSHVWNAIHPKSGGEPSQTLPEFLWDDGAVSAGVSQTTGQKDGSWKGLAVCAGQVTGFAVVMKPDTDPQELEKLKQAYNAPLILVFRSARPQTVDFFDKAGGLVFCTGGMLSHACTVARERNIPSITALGPDFLDNLSRRGKTWLTIDGATGEVRFKDYV